MNRVSKKTEYYLLESQKYSNASLSEGLYTYLEFKRDSDFNHVASVWLNPKGDRVKEESKLYYLDILLDEEELRLAQVIQRGDENDDQPW